MNNIICTQFKRISQSIRNSFKRNPWAAFILPSFIGVAVFLIIPYIDVFRRAFFSAAGNEFRGFANFTETVTNDAFQLAIRNTAMFILVCIPILLALSLMIAVFIYSHSNIGGYLKTCFLVPMAVPIAAAVIIWKVLFDNNGLVNSLLNDMGISTVDWMNTPKAFWILVLSYIWKNLGYNIVLWTAGLSMIPDSIYEAAELDGAGKRTVFFKITLPNLLPMVFIIVVLALINSFKVFREVYLVAGNYPHESIYMVQHLFNNWFRNIALEKIAAGAFMISIVLILLVMLLQKVWESRE